MDAVSVDVGEQMGRGRGGGKHVALSGHEGNSRMKQRRMTAVWATVRAILALLILAPIARSDPAPDCGTPLAKEDGWQVASPAATGLDPATLCGIGPRFQAWTEANVHSVLVIRHGKLVYERYFTGPDERLGRPAGIIKFDAMTKHDLRSITKSVVSLVLGIAIGKGQIASIDQPVLALLPEYADLRSPEKDRITLRDLLTMSQGLAWNEDLPYSDPNNSEEQMDDAPDPVRYTLSRPVESPPGAVFNYSGGSAAIIGRLLRKATGQTIDAYARTNLFEPLGITDFEWLPVASGEPAAASGLRLRPRDTAKLGQLVLDHGAWHGKQVVPADWIAAATAPHINAQLLWFYGYQFWLGRSLVHGREVEWALGLGYGGQRLFIVPALDLVMLVHAGLYRSAIQGMVPLMVLNRYVLPAIKEP
jgi:CubicO group peptidase (beta-lactamase class C family)